MRIGLLCALFFLALLMLPGAALAQAPVAADAYTISTLPTVNRGIDPFLWVTAAGSKTYIRFDLSRLPDTAKGGVTKATARLFVSAIVKPGNFDVFRVTSSWNETTITAGTSPSQDPTPVLSAVSVPPGGMLNYISIDITTLVNNWLSDPGQYPNYGMVLQASSGSAISLAFDSKENPLLSHDSQLQVDFVDASVRNGLSDLQAQVTTDQRDYNELQNRLAEEIVDRVASDTAEGLARQSADALLQAGLNAESTARQAADANLQNSLDTEIAARQAADAVLTASLAAEAQRAKAVEASLASSSGGGGTLPGTPNTITVVDSADRVGLYTSITIGSDGLPLIVYHDDRNQPRVAHCSDRACTSSTTTQIQVPGGGPFRSVTIGPDGLPLIVGPGVVHCTAVDCSTFDPPGSGSSVRGDNSSVVNGADGLAWTSSVDRDSLVFTHCSDQVCGRSRYTLLNDTRDLWLPLDFATSIIVAADGQPAVAYSVGQGAGGVVMRGSVAFFHCWSADCSFWAGDPGVHPHNSRGDYVLADTTSAGVGASAAVDGQGQAVASFISADDVGSPRPLTNRELVLTNCPNPWPSSVNIGGGGEARIPTCPISVVRKGVVRPDGRWEELRDGDLTAVAIGRDGLSIVSFSGVPDDQIAPGDTGVARACAGVPCKYALVVAHNGLTTVVDESSADVGQYSSVAIGTDGLPIISYYDGTNRNLKVVHCGTVSCNPFIGRNR